MMIDRRSSLGHLTNSDENFKFTCHDNVVHQAHILRSILKNILGYVSEGKCSMPKIVLGGHSTGGYIVLHALATLLAEPEFNNDEFRKYVYLTFYCGYSCTCCTLPLATAETTNKKRERRIL